MRHSRVLRIDGHAGVQFILGSAKEWLARPEVTLSSDWEYQVRHRAYELWNAAGRPDGKHLDFWEAAERELKEAAGHRPNGAGAESVQHSPGKPGREKR
jgi:hypothetical protein